MASKGSKEGREGKGKRSVGVTISSMVASADRKPYVVLRLRDVAGQMPPHEARRIGYWLVECAEAAEQDAVLLGMLTTMLEFDDETAYKFLALMRQMRGPSGAEPATGEVTEFEPRNGGE
jgi:hypothetical protein